MRLPRHDITLSLPAEAPAAGLSRRRSAARRTWHSTVDRFLAQAVVVGVGLHHRLSSIVDLDRCQRVGVQVLQRRAGGGALLLDEHMLCGAIALPVSNVVTRRDRVLPLAGQPAARRARGPGCCPPRRGRRGARGRRPVAPVRRASRQTAAEHVLRRTVAARDRRRRHASSSDWRRSAAATPPCFSSASCCATRRPWPTTSRRRRTATRASATRAAAADDRPHGCDRPTSFCSGRGNRGCHAIRSVSRATASGAPISSGRPQCRSAGSPCRARVGR